jgi:hypothetical protein
MGAWNKWDAVSDEELASHGKSLLDNIRKIREAKEKQEKLLKELEYQALLMSRGIRPNMVSRFDYDIRKDNRKDKEGVYERMEYRSGHIDTTVWTHCHLKDGTVIVLDPPIKRQGHN